MITHLSASQINKYKAEPSLWAMGYLMGVKGSVGPGAWRGTATEAALHMWQVRPDTPFEDLVAHANMTFEREAEGEVSDAIEAEHESLPHYLKHAMDGLTAVNSGELIQTQRKIEAWVDGIDIPIIGYIDFEFPEIEIDLKTTKSGPSKPRPDHVWQTSIYNKATGKPQALLYATPKPGRAHPGWIYHQVSQEQLDTAWLSVCATARAMWRVCVTVDQHGLDSIIDMLPPRDMSTFYWDGETRAKAREIWKV